LSLDIACGKCGEKVITMRMLKPIKKAMHQFSNRCTHCGMLLSVTDFSVDVEKK
jgi:DNA-directed RNA polymerase subunit RPC12/RpoP